MRAARRHAWPRALNVNQRSHEGSSGPATALPKSGRAPTWRSGFAFPARGHAERRAARERPMSDIVGLDHVQVAAPPGCEEEARRFYGELLGLEELEKPPLSHRVAESGSASAPRAARRRRGRLHAGHEGAPGVAASLGGRSWAASRRLEGTGVEVTWADPSEIPGRPEVPRPRPVGEPARASSARRDDTPTRTRGPPAARRGGVQIRVVSASTGHGSAPGGVWGSGRRARA